MTVLSAFMSSWPVEITTLFGNIRNLIWDSYNFFFTFLHVCVLKWVLQPNHQVECLLMAKAVLMT